jgi:4-hydroxy-tetrahydrodipicolinate synthase
MMKEKSLQGVITALVTPFDNNGDIDYGALKKLIDFQIAEGIDGIVVCGTTGESATLTLKEKMSVISKSIEFAAGRVWLIAGTGSNETQAAMDLTIFAKEQGADAALIVTPYYNKPTQDGLFEHYRLIADNVHIPIILYNVPGRTGLNMLPETQLKIAQTCKNVIATKEASGNLEQMMQIIAGAPEHFALLSGDDALTLPIISIGGKGVVSVLSNYAPGLFGKCVKSALKGDYKTAKAIHYSLFDLMRLNFIESSPIPVKCALSLMGYAEEVYRMPILPIKPENKKKIKAALKKAGLL